MKRNSRIVGLALVGVLCAFSACAAPTASSQPNAASSVASEAPANTKSAPEAEQTPQWSGRLIFQNEQDTASAITLSGGQTDSSIAFALSFTTGAVQPVTRTEKRKSVTRYAAASERMVTRGSDAPELLEAEFGGTPSDADASADHSATVVLRFASAQCGTPTLNVTESRRDGTAFTGQLELMQEIKRTEWIDRVRVSYWECTYQGAMQQEP